MRNAAEGDPSVAATMVVAVRRWAESRDDIRAIALVGSHARGDARPDSDIDFVLLCSEPAAYVRDTDWVSDLAEVARCSLEDWGEVQSLRVHYRNGTEVEFGLAGLEWAAIPPDRGTADVLRDGNAILLDRDALLSRVTRAVGTSTY